MKPYQAFVCGVLILTLISGCAVYEAGKEAGSNTLSYIQGELKITLNSPLEPTWRATLGAMNELEFPIRDQAKDVTGAVLTSETADDRTINVRLNPRTERLTRVRIQVGTFGDEQLSRLILKKIRSRLD